MALLDNRSSPEHVLLMQTDLLSPTDPIILDTSQYIAYTVSVGIHNNESPTLYDVTPQLLVADIPSPSAFSIVTADELIGGDFPVIGDSGSAVTLAELGFGMITRGVLSQKRYLKAQFFFNIVGPPAPEIIVMMILTGYLKNAPTKNEGKDLNVPEV